MTTLNKSDLQKFSEQSGLQVDGRSEFAYTDRLEHFSKFVRLDLELEINDLKDQLAASQAYAEQLREALETLNKVSNIGCGRVYEALALPRPTSALDAYVEQKVKEKS